jgi:hypothetical protein
MSTRNNRNRNKSSIRGDVKSVKSAKTPHTIEECVYHLGSASQATDYEMITSFLINHVKKKYKGGTDIATALKKGEEFHFSGTMPVMIL